MAPVGSAGRCLTVLCCSRRVKKSGIRLTGRVTVTILSVDIDSRRSTFPPSRLPASSMSRSSRSGWPALMTRAIA